MEKKNQTSRQSSEERLSLSPSEITESGWIYCMNILSTVYPSLTPGFFVFVLERLRTNGFTDQMLKYAIDHILDTSKYPPSIFDILSFKKQYLEEQEYKANYKPPTPEEIAQKEKERQDELERRNRETEEFNRKLISGEIS